MKSYFNFLLSLLLFVNFGYSQTGKLKQAKENLKQQKDITKTIEETNRQSHSSSVKKPFESLIATIFWNITYGIVVESVFEKKSKMHNASFAKYPYVEKNIGNYTYGKVLNINSNFIVKNSYLIESKTLFGNDLEVKFQFLKRMDISFDYIVLLERNNSFTDSFSFYTLMANYHRIRTQKVDIWYGVGLIHVANDVKKSGVAFQAGGEWFIKKPLALGATINSGIINQKSVTKSEVLLKYYHKRLQFFSGYKKIKITSVTVNLFAFGVGYVF